MTAVFEDVACTVCGCVCDDLQLTVDGNRITRAVGACRLSEDWFLEQESNHPHVAAVGGAPCDLSAAIDEAAAILNRSRSPLVYGLSRSSTAGQREAVRLADALGANIDTTASLCHAPSIMAIQSVGESTCSLGEIRNRADLVLFWGVDPARSHPRHFERYSVDPAGEFVPGGRADRTVVVIDVEPTESSALADRFLQIEPGRDFEAIWALRAMIRGLPVDASASLGISLEALRDLAERMKSCRCGVVFFGLGLSRKGLGHLNVEALLRLVADLNDHTRFHARRMRIPGDVTGADTVLCWQTGYPFSVNLSRGYPRYNPGEFSANELLERKEVDACLLVGSEGIEKMSARAVAHLRTIPTIVLDHPTVQTPIAATVRFTTGVYGIHLPGTAYRMDEVPIPLKQVLTTDYPSDAEVLSQIRVRSGR
ncbi:MAG TPA: formylmethanofuran dehydrogenase subunit B [Planctomycetaceae bacterium]|nr:formylmethanofuran dehydrogenase subunit B [Planctomycetaceae bacterium]